MRSVEQDISDANPSQVRRRILEAVKWYWGYDQLRPLQEEAIRAGLDRRDSLVVLPTGGGKSLCYQIPPLLTDRTDIVVSPLISLMKDQVDALRACGYPAATLHSSQSASARRSAEEMIRSGKSRLVFVAPERLLNPSFLELVARLKIKSFTVDEAHCISHWGHDFRPNYRRLATLKDRIPGASIHAFTATATQRVRDDIVAQLRLQKPELLVGRFDRPNLVYRIIYRQNFKSQVAEVLDRHRDEAVIIYCISRDDTERLAKHLRSLGHDAAHYHAGMPAKQRRLTQEAFANEDINIIVATVAFGMGIDRSDVRCVIHAAMPQSIEHYQQETGRAGRDGLEAECILFYSPADVLRWQSLFEKNMEEGIGNPQTVRASMDLLEHMRRFCAPGSCRHKILSEYFEQEYPAPKCNACDVCLEETEDLQDGTVQAQMILSCVVRVGQRFGMGHVVDVLRGADTQRLRSLGHNKLSTYGLMKDVSKRALNHLIFQLIDQNLLTRTLGDYPVLKLSPESRSVLLGERNVWLVPSRKKKERVKKTSIEKHSWEGVDRDLFAHLKSLRTQLARDRQVPPYVIFSDATLRDMARKTPRTLEAFLDVHGVGEKKQADFGTLFLEHIESYLSNQG